jgi:hypothetical protein
MKKIAFTLATLLATLGAAHAQTLAPVSSPKPLRFLLGMGLSAGGDELVHAEYTNGETANIHAGGLIYFTAGADYHFTPEFSLQGTVNYHVDRANASNGDVKFERFPVELIGYYQPNLSWRVGGGVRYTNSSKLSGSGAGSRLRADFDDATSAVVEAEYFTSPNLGIKLRYVNETFKSRGYQDVDGSHVGLSANFYF